MSERHPVVGDGDDPSLVRPYALVGGRTEIPGVEPLPVETVVVTVEGAPTDSLERGAILRLCRTPRSVAELSILLRLPVGVARVIVADLAVEDAVHLHEPMGRHADGGVDRNLLERVLAGLEAL